MSTSNPNPNPNPMKRDRKTFQARPALRYLFDAKVEEMRQRGPVGTREITRLYCDFLHELNRNSRRLILELTVIAAKYKNHAEGIAGAILEHIVEVPVEQKIPSWHLLDCILKKVHDPYQLYFAGCLDTIFIDTYGKLSGSLHPFMVHLFRSWKECIPSFVHNSIKDFLKEHHASGSSRDLSHSGSHSRHQLCDHVNAKYLMAHHQMEHSAVPGCRASSDKFQDYVVSSEESMLRSQNSCHCQEIGKLSDETQGRYAPLAETPVLPHLVPQNSFHVQSQGAVFSPNSSELPTEMIPLNPSRQSSVHTFRPISLPSLHPSPPFSLPSAAVPPPFPAAAASLPSVSTASLTPHRHPPLTPHPVSHNIACPSPSLPPRFNPANPLPIPPTPVATPYNSFRFTYLTSGRLPLQVSGPIPSSQTLPVPEGTNTGISETPASALPGLLSSLMAQGFLSCPSDLYQDDLIDFNSGLPKVRRESSINALYDDLSNQCRTCGMRYISQEDLIRDMVWHMTVVRVARNQNWKPSRYWYVNAKEWVSGWKH